MRNGAVSKRVLVIDDDPVVRSLLSEYLTSRGHHVESIARSKVAMDHLQSGDSVMPDLIMLDMIMPELSGLELLRLIKGNPICAQVPIVMLSANSASETLAIIQHESITADSYLQKPFDFKALDQLIKGLD